MGKKKTATESNDRQKLLDMAAFQELDYIVEAFQSQSKLDRKLVATLKAYKSKITPEQAFRLDALLECRLFALANFKQVLVQALDNPPKALREAVIADSSSNKEALHPKKKYIPEEYLE